jgi:hypothetical protein
MMAGEEASTMIDTPATFDPIEKDETISESEEPPIPPSAPLPP